MRWILLQAKFVTEQNIQLDEIESHKKKLLKQLIILKKSLNNINDPIKRKQ